jgi:[acyl-carrier-protein] S-malonyltransferase
MLKLAFIFPGQGAQYVGMGKELVEHYQVAQDVLDQADQVLGFKLSQLCFEGPQEELNRTENTQPAILAVSIATYQVLLSEGITPNAAAGLSLGEYSSLVASGALSFEEALTLVVRRGRLMQEAVSEGAGMMLAVLGLAPTAVELSCQEASSLGIVDVANYNCPGQLVISGERAAVSRAGTLLKEQGARVVPLAVSVPSHSRLMRESAEKLCQELGQIHWGKLAFPVVCNVSAEPVGEAEIPEMLVKQLYQSVRWEQSVRYLADQVDYLVEVGPGKVLSSL